MDQNVRLSVTDILTWVTLIVVAILAIDYHWKRRWLYYYASKLKGPFAFPFIGSLHMFRSNGVIFDRFLKLSATYGHLSKLWVGPLLYVLVSKPHHVELVLKKYLTKGQQYRFLRDGLGNAILTAPVETWKGHRKLINQTFSQNILNSYLDVFVDHSNRMVDDLREKYTNKQVDLWPEFCKTTFCIVCDTSMGVDHSTIDQQDWYMHEVEKAMKLIGDRFYKPHYQVEFLWNFLRAKDLKKIVEGSLAYVRKIVEKRKLEESSLCEVSKQKGFLSLLLKISQEETWKNQELEFETQGMIIAGFHTTASTESFCMLMLGLHQDVQEKVYQELWSIFGDSDRDVTVEDLNKMEYLFNVCKETMRLFPVAPLLQRYAHEDIDLDGTIIPKESTLLIPVNCIHRDPSYWPNPNKFDPDRFLPEEVEKRPTFSYLPFSVPPRNCIGLKFAEMSMKVTLSTILRKFKVYSTQYDSIESIKLELNILLGATNGYGVTLVPR